MKMLEGLRKYILLLGLALCVKGWAHESITTEARKNYLVKLQESNQVLLANPAVPVKAKTLYQIGVTLEEIRDLFNQDIISHGAVKGLDSNLLLTELARAGFKLELSPKSACTCPSSSTTERPSSSTAKPHLPTTHAIFY